jgi:Putative peptidoglycan binding domain
MNYKRLIAVTVGLTVFAFTGSNAMAHGGGGGGGGHGGFGGGGFHGGGFSSGFRGGLNGGGFRGGFRGGDFRGAGFRGGFRSGGFRGDRFRYGDFDDRFFFGDFGDPFLYYPYPYYGYYPYGYYPYDYRYGSYDSYDQPVYQGSAGYANSVIGEVQLRLARGGYYHGAIDGVSGGETQRAIRAFEHAHALPQDGRIGQRLLTTMGLS